MRQKQHKLQNFWTFCSIIQLIRPFQVFSLFRITFPWENLTGRQGINKIRPRKNGLYGEILGEKCHVESYLILKSVVYLFDSNPILAPKNQSCKSDFDITFDLLLKFRLKMFRKILFFSSEISPKPNRQGNVKQRKNLEWPKKSDIYGQLGKKLCVRFLKDGLQWNLDNWTTFGTGQNWSN